MDGGPLSGRAAARAMPCKATSAAAAFQTWTSCICCEVAGKVRLIHVIPVFFSLFGMLLAIFILIILMMKGFHQFFTILCAVLVVSIFSRMNLHEAFTRTFLSGLTGYLDNYFFMFLWGTLLSVLMEVSGGAMSIARFLIRRLNTGAWIAIPIATGLLAYGGVFAIAATFPIIPIAREVFRAHDIPKRLMPGMLYFGCGTCFMVAPGAVQVQNLVPASALEQSRSCGLVGGWIGAGAMLIIGLVWLAAMIGKEKRLGHHWEDDGVTAAPQQVPAPHPVLALIPLIITVALINWGDGRGETCFPLKRPFCLAT